MAMEQRLVANISQKQTQQQILSPRILQSLEILNIGSLDLEERINTELSENPVLERAMPERENPDEHRPEDPHGQNDKAEANALERSIEFLENFDASFNEDSGWSPPARLAGEEDQKMAALANAPAREETLQDYLLQQLSSFELSSRMRDACIQLIEALNPDGFLEVPPDDVISAYDLSFEDRSELAQAAHNVIRNLDPPGVGATGPGEAMLLQISPDDLDYELFRTLLIDHWDDLLKNGFRKISQKTKYSIQQIAEARELLTTLDPFPGRVFSQGRAEVIKPDVIVEEDDD
ncbi:MAG: hypothetical protein KDB07_11030, partial [Planctomycetes bacterium]|nr:hypothetical protein [Planctomycetota bacterium]